MNAKVLIMLGLVTVTIAATLSWFAGPLGVGGVRAAVRPTLEDRTPDGGLYNPSTQSLVREHHWLESVDKIKVESDRARTGTISFHAPGDEHTVQIRNLPLDHLVPRLNYAPASPPDAFDAFNLMLAEFSRNGLSVPVGKRGDAMAHFETTLPEAAPWTLDGDFKFVPNPAVRPVRIGIINNCLRSGLWEISASDRSGEVYHSWFELPHGDYIRLVSKVNGIPRKFASDALNWRTESVPVDLDRLRSVTAPLGTVEARLSVDGESGFSSQDSRRKLSKGYVLVEKDGDLLVPDALRDLTQTTCHMAPFIEPGKYDINERRPFDLRFLAAVKNAEVNRVKPHTSYRWRDAPGKKTHGERDTPGYVEIAVQLEDFTLQIGNLPIELLVPQEDFAIHGFGVGVLSSSGFAERRNYLIEDGPCPSYAYLCEEKDGRLIGVNSHEYGVEQIFVRTHINEADPWWEITVTLYERIVDLVKYRVAIPEPLHEEMKQCALEYIAPLYLTYRDDNLR